MVARELAGMIWMALAGISVQTLLILEGVVQRLRLPYFRLNGSACLCLGLGLGAAAWYRGEWSRLAVRQWKWVFLRGFFGTCNWVLTVLAVVAGAPLGDVSALASINIVVAALLGRALLGESLRCLHIFALLLSVTGAVLVSKLQMLLGLEPSPDGQPLLGYALALAAGTAAGGIFIAARKSQGISPLVMTTSLVVQESLFLWLLPSAGIVAEVPLRAVFSAPAATAASLAGMLVLIALASTAINVGAQMCPAAASSTIYTSVNMSLGFGAQAVLHHEQPQPASLAGAGFMLLGVASMAAARAWYPASTSGPPAAEGQKTKSPSCEAVGDAASPESGSWAGEEAEEAGSPRSLATFIAAEFAGLSPGAEESGRTTRQRRAAAVADLPVGQMIGAASA